MQDREPQLYTQASHSLLQQHNLKTKDDMKLPQVTLHFSIRVSQTCPASLWKEVWALPQNSLHSCRTFSSPISPYPYTLLYRAVFLTSLSLVPAFPSCPIRNPSCLFPHIYCPLLFCGQQKTFKVPCSAADSTTHNVLEVINCFWYFASTLSSGFIAVCSSSHSLLKHTIVNQDIKLTLQSNQLHFPRCINKNCRTTVEFFKER